MTKISGLILIIIGILGGLFVGIWLCLIGGIVQVIGGITNPEGIQASAIAIGIARIVCTGLAGWLTAILAIIPGWMLLQD